MKIFQQEILDGLEHSLSMTSSVSYASLAEPCFYPGKIKTSNTIKSLASYEDSDLYYIQSILVSSNWNKNDDIFDKQEVWAARTTPEDKPTNLDHDEKTIIGHIVSNWPITEDGMLIDENTSIENLPDKFHILTGSVIYKSFTIPELQERAKKLISEIENGSKYVSMECFFKGFDYGLINKNTNTYKILARNENTSHLTKHLRSYGGTGEHEDYKIGRVLRQITFSGKGFVDKPANPDSIIFNNPYMHQKLEKEKTAKISLAGVSYNQTNINVENYTMNFEQEITDLKTKIEAMHNVSELVKEAYATAAILKDKTIELENIIKAHEATIIKTQTELDNIKLEKEEAAKKADEEIKKKEEEAKKTKSELDTALEALAAYKEQEEDMKKKEKKMARKAALINRGVETELAEATIDKFDDLTDEAFEAVTMIWAAKMPPWLEKKKEDKKNKEKTKSSDDQPEVDEQSLENVEETEQVDLGVGETENNTSEDTTRAALLEFVYNTLGQQLNKGE